MIARTPSRLAWLQRCASRASLLFSSPTKLLTGQEPVEEEAEEEQVKQDPNAPSSSFNQSQLGQVEGNIDDGPRFRRTRSIQRVVEEANAILGIGVEETSESNRNRSNADAFTTTPAESAETRQKKRARGNVDDDDANPLEADAHGGTQRKKRIKDIMVEIETNEDSLHTPHSRVSTPATKRYNFRPSTIVNMTAASENVSPRHHDRTSKKAASATSQPTAAAVDDLPEVISQPVQETEAMHEAPAVGETLEAQEEGDAVAESPHSGETTTVRVDHVTETQVVTETTTIVTETVKELAVFDLNVEELDMAEIEAEEVVPTAEAVHLSRSVELPESGEETAGDSPMQAGEVDVGVTLDDSCDDEVEDVDAMEGNDEVDEDGEAAENGDNGVAVPENGELLSEEESEAEGEEASEAEVEEESEAESEAVVEEKSEAEVEEDVGEVEDDDENEDTREDDPEDEPDDEGEKPSIRAKIWDFLTT